MLKKNEQKILKEILRDFFFKPNGFGHNVRFASAKVGTSNVDYYEFQREAFGKVIVNIFDQCSGVKDDIYEQELTKGSDGVDLLSGLLAGLDEEQKQIFINEPWASVWEKIIGVPTGRSNIIEAWARFWWDVRPTDNVLKTLIDSNQALLSTNRALQGSWSVLYLRNHGEPRDLFSPLSKSEMALVDFFVFLNDASNFHIPRVDSFEGIFFRLLEIPPNRVIGEVISKLAINNEGFCARCYAKSMDSRIKKNVDAWEGYFRESLTEKELVHLREMANTGFRNMEIQNKVEQLLLSKQATPSVVRRKAL